MHYSGDTKPLTDLLHDYFASVILMANQTNLHHVTKLMAVLPHRDVSRLIFNVLQQRPIKNPCLLDSKNSMMWY